MIIFDKWYKYRVFSDLIYRIINEWNILYDLFASELSEHTLKNTKLNMVENIIAKYILVILIMYCNRIKKSLNNCENNLHSKEEPNNSQEFGPISSVVFIDLTVYHIKWIENSMNSWKPFVFLHCNQYFV